MLRIVLEFLISFCGDFLFSLSQWLQLSQWPSQLGPGKNINNKFLWFLCSKITINKHLFLSCSLNSYLLLDFHVEVFLFVQFVRTNINTCQKKSKITLSIYLYLSKRAIFKAQKDVIRTIMLPLQIDVKLVYLSI